MSRTTQQHTVHSAQSLVLMMWMWLSAVIVLVGAKLNAEIEHQTAEDTTVGRAKAARKPRRRYGRYGWQGGYVSLRKSDSKI